MEQDKPFVIWTNPNPPLKDKNSTRMLQHQADESVYMVENKNGFKYTLTIHRKTA